MPPRKDKGKKSDEDSADETLERSTGMMMTEQQLEAIMTNIARSQAETSRLLIENIMATHRGEHSNISTPVPTVPRLGNFAKCTARFDGAASRSTSDDADILEAFIDAVETYKECAGVTDEHALKGLPMLLTGNAAIWWRGVKASTITWDDALRRLRGMYGVPRPAYKVFREVFSQVHSSERADVFVSRIRALLSKLPYDLLETIKLDIVYGLLDRRIRKRVPRESVESIDQLMDKARLVEESLAEVSTVSVPNPKNTNIQPNPVNTDDRTSNPSTADGAEKTRRDKCETSTSKRIRPKCTFCRMFGHTADNCRNRTRDNTKSDEQSAAGPNEPETTELRCYGCGKQGTIRSKCETCKNAANNKAEFHSMQIDGADSTRPVVTVEIATHTGIAILDTGASHSIASPGLYKLLRQEGVQFSKTHYTVGLADGTQRVRPALTCDTSVNLGTRCIPTSFIVFPEADTRTLLGRDFIIRANLILDLARGTWCFADQPEANHPITKRYDLQSASDAELMKVCTSQLTLRDGVSRKLTAAEKARHIKVSDKQVPKVPPPYRLSRSKRLIHKKQSMQKKHRDKGRRPAPEYATGDFALLKTQGANDAGRSQAPKFIPRRELTPCVGDVLPPREKRRRGRPKRRLVKFKSEGAHSEF